MTMMVGAIRASAVIISFLSFNVWDDFIVISPPIGTGIARYGAGTCACSCAALPYSLISGLCLVKLPVMMLPAVILPAVIRPAVISPAVISPMVILPAVMPCVSSGWTDRSPHRAGSADPSHNLCHRCLIGNWAPDPSGTCSGFPWLCSQAHRCRG